MTVRCAQTRTTRWYSFARRGQIVALAICILTGVARAQQTALLPDAPSFSGGETNAPGAADMAPAGQLTGSVVDSEGTVLSDVDVTLSREASADLRRTKTDGDGKFAFANVPPGKFKVTASLKGFAPVSYSYTLQPGEVFSVPILRFGLAQFSTTVDVVASQEELSEAELKVEEHQRLIGFFPNFFVSYDYKAPPLTTRQKFQLAWKNASDPGNIATSGFVAGIEQAQNTFPGYGQGMAGYGKRFGAASGDLIFGTFLGGAIFPTLFKQDPRYFYRGTGTNTSRAWYAITRAFICRGDNGKWQPAYASILGDLSAGAITNLYYPPGSRNGPALTFEQGALNIAGDAFGNVMQELVLKHFTPHAPTYNNDPQKP